KTLKNRRTDILYEVILSKTQSGWILLHLEHQRQPDHDMPFRILEYMVGCWKNFHKQNPDTPLPPVFPMVVYQGHAGWNVPLSFHEYFQVPPALKDYVPQFRYALLDLSHLPDTAIRGDVLVKTAMLMMKHIDDPDLPRLLFGTLFPMLWEFSRSKTGLEYLETLLYYLAKAAPNLEKESFMAEFHKLPNPEILEEIIMPTLAQQWIDEGKAEGKIEGKAEGKIEGLLSVTRKLLKVKFRDIPSEYISRLESMTIPQLETLAEKILTAQTLAELFDT
ncbi:MAG: Rpn family recombination-promoting nuclease/putative transposase, partial [SAR324 cluster bacterium]|nr:Rpn family recombination-promoting nuclease/putative transposase [SAR324 cluster bacterium]